MQVIGHQLGELFLQAVPTVLIILLFYFILRAIFFKPLLAVMAERDSRTAGAEKAAEAAQAAAARKVQQYQEALKQARGQVYAEQEAARKKLLEERAARSRPPYPSFPLKLRAAFCRHRAPALPRERLDDSQSSPSFRDECFVCVALCGGRRTSRRRGRKRRAGKSRRGFQVDQLRDRRRFYSLAVFEEGSRFFYRACVRHQLGDHERDRREGRCRRAA